MLLEDLGDSVTVSIRDDGVGIAAGRLEEAVGEGRVGVAKSIVGRMDWLGGSAKLNTGPGCGTEWELTVPRRGRMTEQRAPTVMVVDDHPIWRDAVARDLAEDGFNVVATADGVGTARRRAAVVQPDVVVMDMRLSDGDGAQATAEVLAVSPSSRILVLSASDERDDVLEAVKAGATGYLVKSASKAELGDAVRATAEGRAVFTPGLAGLVLGEYRRIAQHSRRRAAHAEPDRA